MQQDANGNSGVRRAGSEDLFWEAQARDRDLPPSARRDRRRLEGLLDKLLRRGESVSASVRALWAVRKDKAQLAVRRRVQTGVLIAAAAIAGLTATIQGVLLFSRGLSGGLRELFDGRAWLGELAAGLLLLGALGAGAGIAIKRSNRAHFKRMVAKYDAIKRAPSGEPSN